MSNQEIVDFLSENNVARIATIKPDKTPHVTPVWYLWKNNQLLVLVGKNSVKVKNIRKNNNVAVTIDTSSAPEMGLIIEGKAEIDESNKDIQRRICQRYVSPEDLDKYLNYAQTHHSSVLLKIHPKKMITWDYSKDTFLSKIRPKGST